MISHDPSFQSLLGGKRAFYHQPDYIKRTIDELSQDKPLPTTYTWNTEHKVVRIAKHIFSILIFPIGLYHLLHALVGKVAILPSSLYSLREAKIVRERIIDDLQGEWKYKRMTIEVDGYQIDTMIMGKASTLNNRRWFLLSNGNGELYEWKLNDVGFKQDLNMLDANAIVFNYPGVAVSSGLPNRHAMAKAYQAILNFLEDQEKGIGAKEIIGYGLSIGGGAQGDALNSHELKPGIKYVFLKDRTFSDLATEASLVTIRVLGFILKLLGWNMSSLESSKNLNAPEIILQTAKVKNYEELKDSSKIIDDGVIRAQASLAKALLDDQTCPKKNKLFIGIPENHFTSISQFSFIAKKIKEKLATGFIC